MSKHTPGPWSVPHFAEPDTNCECGYVLCDHLMGAVATVHCSGEGGDWQKHGDNPRYAEAVANARLIAAAPDLLAAILNSDDAHWTPAMRAAIAKATVWNMNWQPIETAPKDYTVVLLYQPAGPGNAEGVGQGHRTSLNEHAHDKWMFQATGWVAEPTHWMPLPEPPTE